ncbi:hypothetical protein RFI_29112 [Reticulomyxa filosa]|uniref:alpha-1,2-Mannosidase n=1 Tax=Reticulomyxa filosa TaxID=46433 RepID=X6M477_RETFI|nr:hypothetical protein RFI_29112 [Reticulomyxa filosa]|eukprot:ETO08277.1 hypothetical protein RFI_29112 [Reticulomyxa filosa]
MAFANVWHGYAKKAIGQDEAQHIHVLVNKKPGDSCGGLGATLIDALDTLMLMGLNEELEQARRNLEKINFNIDLQVSFFETTIRHLGGLIGAYEMSLALNKPDTLYLGYFHNTLREKDSSNAEAILSIDELRLIQS